MQAAGSDHGGVLRRKLDRARQAGGDGPLAARGAAGGAGKAWRVALARAAQNTIGLTLDIMGLSQSRMSLAEVLDLPPERGLILMLDGPEDGLGVMIIAPDVLAGMVEKLTTGRCATAPPESRKPTRTDAAMIAPMVDRALENLESALAEDGDFVWASGFRHASHVDEARALGLLLDDVPFRVMVAKASLEAGARVGEVILILPAEGRGAQPDLPAGEGAAADPAPAFAAQLSQVVENAQAQLAAVIARVKMPLSDVTALTAGGMLPLGGGAGIDRILLETLDGRVLAMGKLGQHRGLRALRLTEGMGAGSSVARALSDIGGLSGAVAGFAMPDAMPDLAANALPDASGDFAAQDVAFSDLPAPDFPMPDFSNQGGFSLDDLPLGATGTDG